MTYSKQALALLPKSRGTREAYHQMAWLTLLDRDEEPATDDIPVIAMIKELSHYLTREQRMSVTQDLDDTTTSWNLFAEQFISAGKEMMRTSFLVDLLRSARPDDPNIGALAKGASVTLEGWCGSDLFLKCNQCEGDRVVVEIKGPTAQFNLLKAGIWQTAKYEQAYAWNGGSNDQSCCTCSGTAVPPLLVILDAQQRDRDSVTASHDGLDLSNWEVLKYSDVLGDENRDPIASWLLQNQKKKQQQ